MLVLLESIESDGSRYASNIVDLVATVTLAHAPRRRIHQPPGDEGRLAITRVPGYVSSLMKHTQPHDITVKSGSVTTLFAPIGSISLPF